MIFKKKTGLVLDHVLLVGLERKSKLGLTLIRTTIWYKVKVIGSKVKVKYTII